MSQKIPSFCKNSSSSLKVSPSSTRSKYAISFPANMILILLITICAPNLINCLTGHGVNNMIPVAYKLISDPNFGGITHSSSSRSNTNYRQSRSYQDQGDKDQQLADLVHIECNSNSIQVTLKSDSFNGMIYPKGLSKNSTCMMEYGDNSSNFEENSLDGDFSRENSSSQHNPHYNSNSAHHNLNHTNKFNIHGSERWNAHVNYSSSSSSPPSGNNITYILPLRSCNTMAADVEDGIEYFNTVVVQPHRKLVTNQGKGFHIRCRYQTKEKLINNHFNLSANQNFLSPDNLSPVIAEASMPTCSMKIFNADKSQDKDQDNDVNDDDQDKIKKDKHSAIAESVKIGDRLTISITIDEQDIYGMKITNCLVRDGLNWGEQPLLNDAGCPVDEEIMGSFNYNYNLTRAEVSFQAHKFPYTSSVYYQCNVRLCLKSNGGCDDVPPNCSGIPNYRSKRDVNKDKNSDKESFESGNLASVIREDSKDLSIEVYSGLHVNENDDEDKDDDGIDKDLYRPSRRSGDRSYGSEEEFCISMRKFAVGVAIASLLLMLAVILLVVCILQRRRRRRKTTSSSNSSIYSGPYSNRGYLRT